MDGPTIPTWYSLKCDGPTHAYLHAVGKLEFHEESVCRAEQPKRNGWFGGIAGPTTLRLVQPT